MVRFASDNVQGIDVPEEISARTEKDGITRIEIICELANPVIHGIHIMAMGDVQGTNRVIEFVRSPRQVNLHLGSSKRNSERPRTLHDTFTENNHHAIHR